MYLPFSVDGGERPFPSLERSKPSRLHLHTCEKKNSDRSPIQWSNLAPPQRSSAKVENRVWVSITSAEGEICIRTVVMHRVQPGSVFLARARPALYLVPPGCTSTNTHTRCYWFCSKFKRVNSHTPRERQRPRSSPPRCVDGANAWHLKMAFPAYQRAVRMFAYFFLHNSIHGHRTTGCGGRRNRLDRGKQPDRFIRELSSVAAVLAADRFAYPRIVWFHRVGQVIMTIIRGFICKCPQTVTAKFISR